MKNSKVFKIIQNVIKTKNCKKIGMVSQKDIDFKKYNFIKRLKEINNIIKDYPNQMIEVKTNNTTKFIN